jgi:hypothetical protein
MIESAVQMPALTHTIETDLDQHWHGYMWWGLGGWSCDLPAMGGKKTARTARKKSELHMAVI